MNTLDTYVQSMISGENPAKMDLLCSNWRAIWVYFVMFLGLGFGSGYTGILVGTAIVSVVPFLATFVWVFLASFYLLLRMARLPLKLKLFIEDSTMGVRPLVAESLRFVSLYEILLMGVFIYPILIHFQCGCSSRPDILYQLALVCGSILGLILFLLPLSSLHSKLKGVRNHETLWVSAEYSSLFKSLKRGENSFDEKTGALLAGLDKVQRDIRQIREWPIYTAVVAKVATALGLPIFVQISIVSITRLLGF